MVRLTFLLRLVAVALTLAQLADARARVPAVVAALLVAAGVSLAPLGHRSAAAAVQQARPLVLAADVVLAGGLLLVAGPTSPFFHYTLATAMLAGALHGRAGAVGVGAALWLAHAAAGRAWAPHVSPSFLVLVGLPSLYPVAGLGAAVLAATCRDQAARAEQLAAEARAQAEADERTRLARDLHDSVTATLLGLSLQAGALRSRLGEEHHPLHADAERLCAAARRAASESRGVLVELRRPTVGERLADALARVATEAERDGAGPVVVTVHPAAADGPTDPSARFELARAVREAVRNAATHAPGARITVQADCPTPAVVEVVVADDGPGFGARRRAEAEASGHLGLVGLTERVARLGGSVAVVGVPGAGTTVTVRVPCRGGPAAPAARPLPPAVAS